MLASHGIAAGQHAAPLTELFKDHLLIFLFNANARVDHLSRELAIFIVKNDFYTPSKGKFNRISK